MDYLYPTATCYFFFRAFPWRSPFLKSGACLPPNGFFAVFLLAAMLATLSRCAGRTRTYIVLTQNQVGCQLPLPRNAQVTRGASATVHGVGLSSQQVLYLLSDNERSCAPQAGFEPTTSRLTAERSATELLGSGRRGTRNPREVVYSHAHRLNYDHTFLRGRCGIRTRGSVTFTALAVLRTRPLCESTIRLTRRV